MEKTHMSRLPDSHFKIAWAINCSLVMRKQFPCRSILCDRKRWELATSHLHSILAAGIPIANWTLLCCDASDRFHLIYLKHSLGIWMIRLMVWISPYEQWNLPQPSKYNRERCQSVAFNIWCSVQTARQARMTVRKCQCWLCTCELSKRQTSPSQIHPKHRIEGEWNVNMTNENKSGSVCVCAFSLTRSGDWMCRQ